MLRRCEGRRYGGRVVSNGRTGPVSFVGRRASEAAETYASEIYLDLSRLTRLLVVLRAMAIFLSSSGGAQVRGIHPRHSYVPMVMSRPLAFSSLPPELVTAVAEQLDDLRALGNFAAVSAACLAAARHELSVALRAAVKRCLLPGRSCRGMEDLVKAPAFRLPDDLVTLPAGAVMHCEALTPTPAKP